MIKLATLFSGIGAIEQALYIMGLDYKIIFACDNGDRELPLPLDIIKQNIKSLTFVEKKNYIDKLYKLSNKENLMEKSYKSNYKINNKDFYQDIRFLDGTQYKDEIDLLVGGSPCQAFSVNGKRKGLEDTRGTLFYEYARIVKETQPKVFIYENVRGMLNHDNCRTWEVIKETFYSLNYKLYIKKDSDGKENPILNSVDFGIPQNRERIFIIGIKNSINLKKEFTFPNRIKLTKTVKDFYEKEIDEKYYLGKKGFEFVTTHPSRARVGTPVMGCQKANQQFNWNGDFIFEELNTIKNKNILEKAYIGDWNGKTGVIRKYTPRECLRLMGFSDDFKIVVNDQNMYKQTGNSIVVNVLIELIKEIKNTGVFND